MTAVPWLPGVRWWKAGRGRRSLHVARAGHRVQAGQDGEVAGLGGLVEDGPDEVVEYLPPELEVVVAVFLTVSNPRTPGLVKADEPGFGSSCRTLLLLSSVGTEMAELTNKVHDLNLVSIISKSR